MARARDKASLITDAELSSDEQMHIRQVRYGVMMAIRALLLIVATALFMLEPPLLWLWLVSCAVGMVILPWTAVLVANDRLPKKDRRRSRGNYFRRRQRRGPPQLGSGKSQVIDVDS